MGRGRTHRRDQPASISGDLTVRSRLVTLELGELLAGGVVIDDTNTSLLEGV